ncbi:MAG: serine hydrolase [Pseudomonadota bacterium]
MMNTFPPSADAQVTLANWRLHPFNRWAFHHVSEVVPSAVIRNDPDNVQHLEIGSQIAMPGCTFSDENLDFAAFSDRCQLDGLVILHKGRIIAEHYPALMRHQDPHILMSVSKSSLGLLAGILSARGLLDIEAPVTSYIPEVARTGFAESSVRHLLDMRSGVAFVEDYLTTVGPMIEYRKSTNWNPLEPGEQPNDLRGFFLTLTEKSGPDGGVFDYKSPCTDLLGWVIERAGGQPYAEFFTELLWGPMQAEAPAMITVDRLGAPRAAGGLSMTTRSLAQVGQLLVEGGGGVIPADWIEDIETAGDPQAWDDGGFKAEFGDISMHYRSKWYVMRERGPILMGLGVHGQNLIVDRKAELVMARFCSAAAPLDVASDLAAVSLFEAVREILA